MFEHVTFVIFLCDVIKLCNSPYLAQSFSQRFLLTQLLKIGYSERFFSPTNGQHPIVSSLAAPHAKEEIVMA